ncbi:recombinase family protein [Eubacterium sp. 1001713B170207_170306_E7]|uniref:recombinase family protein n=1 Tax=Eubacterium sp. 1001713B170207_170306_E7 TaxID=2787097 RepID=UPI00189B6223|nr:recombinase family protein [Eubacterium sp. 1001713B170207_170306_E7]
MTQKYGYIRVSSKDQNLWRQIDAMTEQGIPEENIFTDKITGGTFIRPGYEALLEKIKKEDILFIHGIDRLGRNYDEIIENWNLINRKNGADIVVLDMPLLDTRVNKNGLTGKFLSDIVLQILSYFAQLEKEKINQRQKEGIAAAKKRGVKFGRPKKKIDMNYFQEIVSDWRKKKITCEEAVKILNISRAQFYKIVKIHNL